MPNEDRTVAKRFRILIGSDGSPSANAALAAAAAFPWPEPSRATGVVALGVSSWTGGSRVLAAATGRALHAEADVLRRKLGERWPDANVVELHEPAAAAILGEAKRIRAEAIVLGWRGHGTFKRLLAGSVSRQVVAAAPCPVLVVRAAPTRIRRFVIGFDGRPTSRRALRFLAGLTAPAGGLAILVDAVEPIALPTSRIPRQAREAVRSEIVRINNRRLRQARRKLEAAARLLRRSGWRVKTEVMLSAPLASIFDRASEFGADALVLGARTTSGVARLLLGSVAMGALDRSPIPVMIVP
jgi:nucleotide-binding universal stress UspA family protein